MEYRKNFYLLIRGVFINLIIIMVIVAIIDPYFHYHKPLTFLSYKFSSERYINDGIIRHFDYDSIITGTSMTENFKSSQFDKIFKSNSIKVPFSGASYKEINDNLEKVFKYNPNVKIILRGLDYGKITDPFDRMEYDNYPEYLYDDNIFNDYKYLLNKDVIFKEIRKNILLHTFNKNKTTTFDKYANWNDEYTSGKSAILKYKKRKTKTDIIETLSKEQYEIINKNIEKNITSLPKKHPNTRFIYFITPYSILYWDDLNQSGEVEKQIMAEKFMIEKILEVPNIELYSFFNNYDMICNLDNYKDAGHYMENINEKILEWIEEGKYKITKKNYKEYIERNLKFYKNYNYDEIYK
ncbi:hypothetical protein [Fusobacterium sp.]|uniref:hypothetical protein n=1 Tax=Fusobacterium sp. TaxID=68766 RepID=UPI00260C2B95|nr:hypothetical protein [Fusobacterium sp.]